MPDAVVVRCLAPTEAGVLRHVAQDVFDHDVREDYLQAFFDDPHSLLAVAIDDGVVVGMASGLVYGHPDKPLQLFVNEVGVAPTHQRRGLGRELVRCLLARGRELGCAEAWVATEEENAAARQLYAATGGREEASRAVVFTYTLKDDEADGVELSVGASVIVDAALRSEALLFGEPRPAAGSGPHRALLARAVTGATPPVRAVWLREIAEGAAWSRYLDARVEVEAAYGLDREAVRAIVARMRVAAETHPVRWSFLLDEADVAVGAVGRLEVDAAGVRVWRLQDVDVFPPFRGRGFGNALLDATMERAARDGVAAVVVGADEDDWPLLWYQRHGFVRIATVGTPRTAPFAGLPM